jgi:hypothetical protein
MHRIGCMSSDSIGQFVRISLLTPSVDGRRLGSFDAAWRERVHVEANEPRGAAAASQSMTHTLVTWEGVGAFAGRG